MTDRSDLREDTSGAAPVDKGGDGAGIGLDLVSGNAPPTIAAALLAWATTVAPVAFSRSGSLGAGALAIMALSAGVAGPIVGKTRARLGRHVGISLFALLAALVWLTGSAALHPSRLDPVRGAFGAIAWGVFALSWSERWGAKTEGPPPDPDAPLLIARSGLPPLSGPITAAGVLAALVYLVLAWRVREPDRALWAQAVGTVSAVFVLSAAAIVATSRGKARSSSGRRLTPEASRALILLVAAAIAGAVIIVLR